MLRSRAGPLIAALVMVASISVLNSDIGAPAAPATGIDVQAHADPPSAITPDASLSAAEFGYEGASSGDNMDFRIARGSPTQSAGPPAYGAEESNVSIDMVEFGTNTGGNDGMLYVNNMPTPRAVNIRHLDLITGLSRSLHAAEVRVRDQTETRSNLVARTPRDALS